MGCLEGKEAVFRVEARSGETRIGALEAEKEKDGYVA